MSPQLLFYFLFSIVTVQNNHTLIPILMVVALNTCET